MRNQDLERWQIRINGLVQGVGFRPFLYNLANLVGVKGWVRNNFAGVEIEIEGQVAQLDAFQTALRTKLPPTAVIDQIEILKIVPLNTETGFKILTSAAGDVLGSPLPDQGICGACQAECLDPADRRYGYPFNSCTICGPRFTIIRELPFDREHTTMTDFPLCPECQAEYSNPADRRFHGQTISCPKCGPELWFTDPGGQKLTGDPIARAQALLKSGAIIAIKGVGGYHLACDAHNEATVRQLRQLKGRDNRPFAVMFRDLTALRTQARANVAEIETLESPARPIILLPQETSSDLATAVNPGLQEIGAFLPYTGIQLLLFDSGLTALVMTSGNRSGEPLTIDEPAALSDLGPMVAGFLMHNRSILWRCDDSVLRLQQEKLVGIRRSRGYAPAPIKVERALVPILACGAQQKNSFALTKGDLIYLSQHQGDLDELTAFH